MQVPTFFAGKNTCKSTAARGGYYIYVIPNLLWAHFRNVRDGAFINKSKGLVETRARAPLDGHHGIWDVGPQTRTMVAKECKAEAIVDT